MAVKTVSDDPGACLDKLAAREQKRSSINDNEPRARRAKQVEDSSARTRRRMSRSARSVYCLDAQKFLDADLKV